MSVRSFSPLPGTQGRGAGGEGLCLLNQCPLTPTPLPGVPGRGVSATDKKHDSLARREISTAAICKLGLL